MAEPAVRPDAGAASVAIAAPEIEADHVPAHAVRVPGGNWQMWRTAIVRGAGFPAHLVLELASDATAAAADRYIAAVDDAQQCRDAAMTALARQLTAADQTSRRHLGKLRKKIARNIVPDEATGAPEAALRDALAARDEAATALAGAFAEESVRVERRLADLAREPRFHEALLWQDADSTARVLAQLRDGAGTPGQRRRAADYVAMHAQRYAVKNDAIGFFGPCTWASIVDDPITLDARPGPRLLSRREVYFEGWGIEELTNRLNQLDGIRQWTMPRLRTGAWRNGDMVYRPGDDPLTLAPLEARVLDACNGQRTAVEVIRLLGEAGIDANQANEIFESLVAAKVLTWRFEVAPQLYPERELERRLERIDDPVLRAIAFSGLDQITSARAAVAAAAGRPEELGPRLRQMDETFTMLTGCPASRSPGRMYSARRLLYEDCQRDCEVRIGRALLERIGPPLTIALDAARWAAGELSTAVRALTRRRFAELAPRPGTEVEAVRFLQHVRHLAMRRFAIGISGVDTAYHEKWASVLQLDRQEGRRTYHFGDLADRARAAFAAPRDGWSRTTAFSPDLMIAANGIDAVRRGELHGVLGELHSSNTLAASAPMTQHPHPEIVFKAMAHDTEHDPWVLRMQPDAFMARLNPVPLPHFLRYEDVDHLPSLPSCRSLPAAMMMAYDDGTSIKLRARDGSAEFDALELFNFHLVLLVNEVVESRFAPAPYQPRFTVDDLTISREAWYVTVGDLAFLAEKDGSRQFAAVRRWARALGMPRCVFYKPPIERKPCFLDFDSPLYVRIFINFMKRLPAEAKVRLVEMLPGLHETWLPDAAGERYTCELRLTARPAPPAR